MSRHAGERNLKRIMKCGDLDINSETSRLKNIQFFRRLQISGLCRKYLPQLFHGDVAAAENDNDLFARESVAELEGGRE